MLEHYSHIRLDAKRSALDALSQGGRAGYGTNDATNESETGSADAQLIEKNGGREGIRTLGLLVANEESNQIRRGAATTYVF